MALIAAQHRLAAGGLAALTARKVADDIGYAVGTLYNLFDDFDTLIVHVNGMTLDLLHDALAPAVTGEDTEGDLAALLKAYLQFLDDRPHLWAALFEHRRADDTLLPDWYLAKVDRVLGLLEKALGPVFLAPDDPGCAEAARVLWAGLHGICSLGGAGKLSVISHRTVADMAASLVENYVAGLRCTVRRPTTGSKGDYQ